MPSPTLKKGLEAVQVVALRGELSVRELAAAMDLPKSTAHRLLGNLVDARMLQVTRRPDGDFYSLGTFIANLSGAAFSWRPLVQQARSELEAVCDDTGETVGIHMLYGDRRVLLDQVVSRHEHRWVYGNHMVPMPLRAGATGKMFLALLDPSERAEVLQRELREAPPKKALDLQLLNEQVDAVRKQGYSISADELNPGITSIAVAVMDQASGGLPRTVISLAAPSLRVPDKARKQYVRRLRSAARLIAARLRMESRAD